MSLQEPKLESQPPDWFQEGFNPRPVVRDESFSELVESIRQHGILQPLGALEDGRKLWGNRRHAAAIEAGLKLIPAMIYRGDISLGEMTALTLTENLHRQDQTDYQTYLGLDRLEKECPKLQRKEIAKMIGKSAGMVTQYLCPRDLCPEAMEAFQQGKFGITKAYSIVTSPNQQFALASVLSGASRERLAKEGRKKRAASAPAVRTSKAIKVPLVSGATVTVSGDEITLEDAIEAAGEAIKNMKAALSKGLNAKTAMNVWKDVAAAG